MIKKRRRMGEGRRGKWEGRWANGEKRGVRGGGRLAKFLVLSFSLVALSFRLACASTAQLKEGNRQFKNKHYDKALKLYEDALIDAPYSSILHFNAGDAALLSGDAAKAQKYFEDASQSANPVLKGASQYNRGNSLFYEGKYADAIEAYKDSLRANPADQDAKYNLGIALRALKNPPPPKMGQGQGKPDQKKGGGKNQKSGEKQQAGAQAKQGQMSKEDAERLMAAAGSGEKKKTQAQSPKGDLPHPDEDW